MMIPMTDSTGKVTFDSVIVPLVMHWLVRVEAGETAVFPQPIAGGHVNPL